MQHQVSETIYRDSHVADMGGWWDYGETSAKTRFAEVLPGAAVAGRFLAIVRNLQPERDGRHSTAYY